MFQDCSMLLSILVPIFSEGTLLGLVDLMIPIDSKKAIDLQLEAESKYYIDIMVHVFSTRYMS